MVRITGITLLIILSHNALATTESSRLPGTEVQDVVARLSGKKWVNLEKFQVGGFPCGSGSKSQR